MAFYTGSQEIVDKVLSEHWMRRCAKMGGMAFFFGSRT